MPKRFFSLEFYSLLCFNFASVCNQIDHQLDCIPTKVFFHGF